MTIKFICSCGKHLKARDNMAARRSICPRCGSPVGIPALKPTQRGTEAAPLSPLQRLRHARERKPLPTPTSALPTESTAPPPRRPADPRLVYLLSRRGVRQPHLAGRHLEKHWYQCMLYPLRAWRLCLGLALFLTLISTLAALVLPHLLADTPTDPATLAAFRLSCVLLPIVIVGLPCSFLDCVLASAVDGEVYYIVWSGNALTVVLKSGVKWLTCFLAGPLVFAAVGLFYWLKCGDPALADTLILMELGVVAIAYWLFALVSLTDRGWWRDLNPLTVADMAHRLGWRALAAVLSAALLLVAHGWMLLNGLADVHTSPPQGFAILTFGWLSALYCSTFFCRLLGVWCHRSRLAAAPDVNS